ncbi:MAG: phosphatidylglycerol lysyltransferase domain-containing protein [Eubacteriales bacterium]
MISFKKITLREKDLLNKYFKYHKERSCDFTVGVALMWKDFYSIEYAVDEDTLFLKYTSPSGDIVFPYPQGENPKKGLDKIYDYCIENNLPPIFCFITENDLKIIENHFTEIEAKDERMWSDYLYDAQSIISLEGKKYRGQRNHINKFLRTYPNFSFEQITQDTKHEAQEFFEEISENFDKTSQYALEDQKKAKEVIKNCSDYSMFGAMLKVSDTVIGISYGEILNDTLYIHIERANTEYLGAYQMLVNSFAKAFVTEDIKYINREDDSGDPGLRQSKLSYNPIKLIDKYNVKIIKK